MHRNRASWLFVLLAVSTLAAACGGGDDAEETTATTTPSETTSAPAEQAEVDRTGETIKVGYVNNEGGAISLPEFRFGGEVAIGFINDDGGIHGATIEVVPCNADASPEGSINCANELIEAGVVMAYTGIDVASDAALPLYVEAGIPFVTSNSWGDQQRTDPGAFILHAAGAAFTVAPLSALKDLGATKIAVILEDTPAGTDFLNNIAKPVGEGKLGLEIEAILVDPAAPDYATAVATAQSADVDAIWGQLTEPGCLGLVQATAASGFDGPIFAGSCSFYISILGDAAVGTYTQSDIYFPDTVAAAPPEIQTRLEAYADAMTAADAADKINGFAAAPYSAWFEIRPILEAIEGDITAASIIEAFQNAGTTPGWLGPDLHCGERPWPSEPSHCSGEIAVWKVEKADDGSLIRTSVVDFENPYELTQ